MKILLVAILALSLNACALTGNTGPVHVKVQNADCSAEFDLPMGSGRVYPDGIKVNICGQEVLIPTIEQGEDRTGIIRTLLGFIL